MLFYAMNFVHEDILNYATAHSNAVSSLLNDLEKETHQKILYPRMLSGVLQGRFLSMMAKLLAPNVIVEVGTYTGYATLCLAEGLSSKGVIHTIDCNEELTAFQKKYFNKSIYTNQIKPHLGLALDIIPTLPNAIDLVFLDADKENYLRYFEDLLPKMRKGGLIISDNVLWSGKVLNTESTDVETTALRHFNQCVREDSRVTSVLLPVRDGLLLSRVN